VPGGAPFHYPWGARNLTTGFPVVPRAFPRTLGLPEPTVDALAPPRFVSAIMAAMLLASTLVVTPRTTLSKIPDRVYQFPLIGGLLVAGCCLARRSVGYRGVFMLLLLPGLLVLCHAPGSGRSRGRVPLRRRCAGVAGTAALIRAAR
jgi:hypothetical protein